MKIACISGVMAMDFQIFCKRMFVIYHIHTRHGLHLNKKGRDWVVNNVIKEIRNWKLSCKVSSPRELPWKNEMNDLGNQDSPVIVSVGKEGLSPNCKNDGHPESGDSAAEVDSLSQTDVERLGQT